jgi:hypothetical protein
MTGISKVSIAAVMLLGVSVSRARAQDPCGLVTKEEMSALAGFTVDVATPQSVGGATSCVYGAKTRGSVQVRTYSGAAAAGAEAMCRGGAPVAGIGEKACMVTRGPAVTLQVTKGASVLMVVWFGAPRTGAEGALKRIAGKALARMK